MILNWFKVRHRVLLANLTGGSPLDQNRIN